MRRPKLSREIIAEEMRSILELAEDKTARMYTSQGHLMTDKEAQAFYNCQLSTLQWVYDRLPRSRKASPRRDEGNEDAGLEMGHGS